MSLFVNLAFGPKLYLEYARWATPARRFDLRRENGEVVVWVGRWHLIYTPPRWSPPAGEIVDDGIRSA